MFNRRTIRETAVQFLYLADFEDNPQAADMQEAFWEMAQESGLRKLKQARATAILHVARGRENRMAKLTEQAGALQTGLQASEDGAQLVAVLERILTGEQRLSKAIESLKSSSPGKHAGEPAHGDIQAVIDASHQLVATRLAWRQALEELPSLRGKLEPITIAIDHLQRISERLDAIEDQESTIGDFAHLRASHAELTALREQTQALVTNILQHKEEIDAALAGVIENYAPERVDPVDRAILRMATYELRHCDDIPRAVAINEAIEIARKFGTQDSARFVNGVLDAL